MCRKLIACLLVFFLICSPAYASTSSSALDYQVMSMSLEDNIMSVASDSVSSFNLSYRTGVYNPVSDAYTWGSWVNKSVVDGSFASGSYGRYYSAYAPDNYIAYQIKVSDFGSLSQIRFLGSEFLIYSQYNYGLDDAQYFYVNKEAVSPVLANVDCHYTGTLVQNNSSGSTTFITSEVNSVEPLSSVFRPQSGDSNYMLLDVSLPFDYPSAQKWEYGNDSTPEVRNVKCDEFVITLVFRYDDTWVSTPGTGRLPISEFFTLETGQPIACMMYVRPQYFSLLSDFVTDSSGIGSGFSNLSNMISVFKVDVNKQFSEVKQTIIQGASEVKTEISVQTQTLTDKLTDVKDGIVQGVTELKETTEQGFEDVVQGITDLPGKIQEMLTDFIVPDEDTVADKMTDFQSLAEEKLGIIYQVPEMMFDAVNALVNGATNPQSTMTFPAFSLPWIDGSQLKVWDSQQFEIIPSGLENLRDLIQTVTSMVFVIMTFNSLKRAYERFFLGGDS